MPLKDILHSHNMLSNDIQMGLAISMISTRSKLLKISKWVSTGTKISSECFINSGRKIEWDRNSGCENPEILVFPLHWKLPEIQAGIFQ